MKPKTWPELADWQGGSRFYSLYHFMNLPATRDLNNPDFVIAGLPID